MLWCPASCALLLATFTQRILVEVEGSGRHGSLTLGVEPIVRMVASRKCGSCCAVPGVFACIPTIPTVTKCCLR